MCVSKLELSTLTNSVLMELIFAIVSALVGLIINKTGKFLIICMYFMILKKIHFSKLQVFRLIKILLFLRNSFHFSFNRLIWNWVYTNWYNDASNHFVHHNFVVWFSFNCSMCCSRWIISNSIKVGANLHKNLITFLKLFKNQ